MSCERCIDVHKAQAVGATQNKCTCDCHQRTVGTGNDFASTFTPDPNSISFLNMTDCTSNGGASVVLNPDNTFS